MKYNFKPLERAVHVRSAEALVAKPVRYTKRGFAVAVAWMKSEEIPESTSHIAFHIDEENQVVAFGFTDAADLNGMRLHKRMGGENLRRVNSPSVARHLHVFDYPARTDFAVEKIQDNLWLIVKPEVAQKEAEDGRDEVQFPER